MVLKMARPKKRKLGHSYSAGNSFSTGRASVIKIGGKRRKRFSLEVCKLALQNSNFKTYDQLPGVGLRPLACSTNSAVSDEGSQSDIIDLKLQQNSYKQAHSAHKLYSSQRNSTKHIPALVMMKVSNQGFGTTVQYKCKNCSFLSQKFNLFATTSTGACVTNIQSGIAFSKTCIKPTDAEFLFNAMGVSCPSRVPLQKHFNDANGSCDSLLQESLSQNRGLVRDYVGVLSQQSSQDSCPSVCVSFDGQFNRPTYHGFDGKATSVSEPVIEHETNLNLLVGHAVVSKKDGSYAGEKVSLDLLT